MDFLFIVNDYFSYIDGAVSNSATAINVSDFGNIPESLGGKKLLLTAYDNANPNNASGYEFILVTSRSGNTLTVERGAYGTTPLTFAGGEFIAGNITKEHFDEIETAIESLDTNKQNILAEGAFVNGDKTKLNGIEDGAQVNTVNPSDIANFETTTQLNARDTANRSRSNHTGTQTASTISDFDTEVENNTQVSANTTHRGQTNNPHSVTKAQVGLSNVDNTSDVNKPISDPQFAGWYATGIAFERTDTNKIRTVSNLDLTGVFRKKDKLEIIFATSGVFYAFIENVTLVSGKTEFSVFVSLNISLPVETINTVRVSRQDNPWGYPTNIDRVHLSVGMASNQTTVNNTLDFDTFNAGTLFEYPYNTTTKTFTAPFNMLGTATVTVRLNSTGDNERYGVDYIFTGTKGGSALIQGSAAGTASQGINSALSFAMDKGDTLRIQANFQSSRVIDANSGRTRLTIQGQMIET